MGSPDVTSPACFDSAKGRIDKALGTLRQELAAMQQQDVVLLRQLMHIHTTIQTMNGRRAPYLRSVSFTSRPASTETTRPHRTLSRLQSAPGGPEEEDEEFTEDAEEEQEGQKLSQSFSAFGTDQVDFAASPHWADGTSGRLQLLQRSCQYKMYAPIIETPEPPTSPPNYRPPSPPEELSPSPPAVPPPDDFPQSLTTEVRQPVLSSSLPLSPPDELEPSPDLPPKLPDCSPPSSPAELPRLWPQSDILPSLPDELPQLTKSSSSSITPSQFALFSDVAGSVNCHNSCMASVVPRESWPPAGSNTVVIGKYEPSYEKILKRSSQLWRDVQKERKETGTVDHKKITTLNLFL